MLRGGVSLSADQIKIEMAREQSILSAGKKFLSLRLIDQSKNRIQGAICLHATSYLDAQTNMTKFHFEERGGPLDFQIDEFKGGMYCRMLDCEHNRKFLASMYAENFWEIENKDAEKEVKELSIEMSKNAVVINRVEEPKEKKMSDAEIEADMARLQAELARRKIEKEELLGKKSPGRPKKIEINKPKGEMVSIE